MLFLNEVLSITAQEFAGSDHEPVDATALLNEVLSITAQECAWTNQQTYNNSS